MSYYSHIVDCLQFSITFFLTLFLESRQVHRWVAPTLSEIRARRKKLGPQKPVPRSSFLEWNYDAEIYAFGVRLSEKFDANILRNAFVDRSYIVQEEMRQRAVGIENPELQISDNSKLIVKGDKIMKEYITSYLTHSLPKFPQEGIKAIYEYLTSIQQLHEVSSGIGTNDLILSADFPVEENVSAATFKAVVGALYESSGEVRACEFIRDILLVQLNQKDVNDLWQVVDPMQLLLEICSEKKIGEPEPRLLGDAGVNTVLASYHVGIYCNKKQIGSGFGEDVTIATNEAAKDSLRTFFGTSENMTPFDFKLPVEKVMVHLKKAETAKAEKI